MVLIIGVKLFGSQTVFVVVFVGKGDFEPIFGAFVVSVMVSVSGSLVRFAAGPARRPVATEWLVLS